MIRKGRTFELEDKLKSELLNSTAKFVNLTSSENPISKSSTVKKKNICVTDTSKKNISVEIRRKEKLLEANDKQRRCKRKFEEEMTGLSDIKDGKKKKLLTLEPRKNSNNNQINESISKISSSIHSKSTGNLLHYFSKTSSEQIEKERLKEAKITIKAEVHSIKNIQIPNLLDNKQRQENLKAKELSSQKIMEEYDEICLIQSETIVLSPNDKKPIPSIQPNKPKWSLKIQLQSNDVQGPDFNDEIYIPTALSAQLKENVRNDGDIPKILLPIKNKRTGWNTLSSLTDGNKEKRIKNLKSNNKNIKAIIEEQNKTVPVIKSETHFISEIKKNNSYDIQSKNDHTCHIFDKPVILKKKSSGKLAPLFSKKMKSTSGAVTVKRVFLQSDSHKNIDNAEKNNFEVMVQKMLPFPKISHINQITSDAHDIIPVNRLYKTYNFLGKGSFQSLINFSTIKPITKVKSNDGIFDEIYESVKSNTNIVLAQLKTHYSDIQYFWETISNCSKLQSLKPKEVKVKEKKMTTHINNTCPNSSLWTDKYKPNNSRQVIGNETAVLKLKTWLKNWQSLKTTENYSSSEEFCISDSSSSSESIYNKVAVLIGPHGSGKTASVYAVAQELGYMVLEVNASSKRPGKKILKEFEEATKSHRVENVDLESLLAVSSYQTQEADKISKDSLIFMKDIDLIFEEDDGFVSAVFQLSTNTKRPIIMTLRNACLHLPKMAPQQLQIDFKPVISKKVLVLLQLITLAETGYQINQNCVDALCQYEDLRKSILQLQYLLISGKERILHTSLGMNNLSWINMKTYIYKPAIGIDKIRRNKKLKNYETMNHLLVSLDNFALVSNLMYVKDPTSTSRHVKYEASISFIPNAVPYCSLDDVSLEIGNWIFNSMKNNIEVQSTCKETTDQSNDANEIFETSSTEEHVIHINSMLSKVISPSLDHVSINVDYLPSIRSICRAEKDRNQFHSKRGNRFFHYLRNTRLASIPMKSNNIFSAACEMLEK